MKSSVSIFVVAISMEAILACVGCQETTRQEIGKLISTRKIGDVEALKASFPDADEWLECQHNGLNYIFCSDIEPSFGVSKVIFRGWVFREFTDDWERIFLIETRGLGDSAMDVDSSSGIFTVMGTATNKFRGKKVVVFDLNATKP